MFVELINKIWERSIIKVPNFRLVVRRVSDRLSLSNDTKKIILKYIWWGVAGERRQSNTLQGFVFPEPGGYLFLQGYG